MEVFSGCCLFQQDGLTGKGKNHSPCQLAKQKGVIDHQSKRLLSSYSFILNKDKWRPRITDNTKNTTYVFFFYMLGKNPSIQINTKFIFNIPFSMSFDKCLDHTHIWSVCHTKQTFACHTILLSPCCCYRRRCCSDADGILQL